MPGVERDGPSLRVGKFGTIQEALADGVCYDELSWAQEAIASTDTCRYGTGVGYMGFACTSLNVTSSEHKTQRIIRGTYGNSEGSLIICCDGTMEGGV